MMEEHDFTVFKCVLHIPVARSLNHSIAETMLLAYDYGTIIQSCLPHPKTSRIKINSMFKTIRITFSYLSP